jgi:hypothetical protein
VNPMPYAIRERWEQKPRLKNAGAVPDDIFGDVVYYKDDDERLVGLGVHSTHGGGTVWRSGSAGWKGKKSFWARRWSTPGTMASKSRRRTGDAAVGVWKPYCPTRRASLAGRVGRFRQGRSGSLDE